MWIVRVTRVETVFTWDSCELHLACVFLINHILQLLLRLLQLLVQRLLLYLLRRQRVPEADRRRRLAQVRAANFLSVGHCGGVGGLVVDMRHLMLIYGRQHLALVRGILVVLAPAQPVANSVQIRRVLSVAAHEVLVV